MILTGSEIKNQVGLSEIVISPFCENQLNPNSYNYRIGSHYIVIDGESSLDTRKPPRLNTLTIPESGITLLPGHLYLCNTLERIGSKRYVTSLIGKSSLGRLGLFLQVSANLGHQGEVHQWTLELYCVKPIRIYPGMVIGQVTFWATEGESLASTGYYKDFDHPMFSRGLV